VSFSSSFALSLYSRTDRDSSFIATGPKTLCNACGLRWSKARSQAQAADVKKKADAVAASAPPVSNNNSSNVNSSSDESRPGSGSRESSGASTNPTTNSPSSQTYSKAFSPQDQCPQLLRPPSQVFAPAPTYGDTLIPPMPPPHFGYSSRP